MRDTLSALCGSFIENRDVIRESFVWENTYLFPVCAAIFMDKRRKADREHMKRCREILAEETGIFSNFRGAVKLPMISMMAVDQDPANKLAKALNVYSELKSHFFSSEYLPVASMIIADMAESCQYGEIAARTRRIYELMKREHPFLTSGEDSVFAALLSFSDLSDEEIVKETELCYSLLKPEFFSGNAVQSLSHVLALGGGNAKEQCARVKELYLDLKSRGCKYGTDYELATLGVLAMLPEKTDSLAADIAEVDGFLADQKGYGFFGIGRKQRLMHAAMIVSSDYTKDAGDYAMNTAAIGGTISMIAAQQAAMCAAIAASGAAAASSSNSSN